MNDFFVNDYALDKLGFEKAFAGFLDELDVVDVCYHLVAAFFCNLLDCVDCYFS